MSSDADSLPKVHLKSLVEDDNLDTQFSHNEILVPVATVESPDRLAERVSYGPGGVRGLISSPYVFGAAFLASLGGFSFGYDQGVISIINVMPQFHAQFPETSNENPSHGFYTGFMTGMLEFGAFIGCFFMPWLADRISRKWALSVAVVTFNIGAIIQTSATSYAALVAGRTIGGFGVGTLALGAPLYISEIAPPQLRGSLLVLESVSIVTGVVVAFWITFGTRHMEGEIAFRLPFGLQMACATVLGFCIHFFPYSPRWLALVGRDDDALLSLSTLRRLPAGDPRVITEWQGILTEGLFQKHMQDKNHPGRKGFKLEVLGWIDLFRNKTWRRTTVGCGIAFFQQFSGINAFIYYAPILFVSLGQSTEMALIFSGILSVLQLVATACCFFIIDRVGRRTLAIFGGIGMVIPYVIMAILVGLYSKDWHSHAAAGWVAASMSFIYVLIYGVSYGPLGWALPSEVFSNSSRAKGVALATATVWLSNFIVGVAVPPMLDNLGFGTYVFFACFCLLASVWAFLFVPETKGRTLEEMDDVFHDDSAKVEKEIMRQAAMTVIRPTDVTRYADVEV